MSGSYSSRNQSMDRKSVLRRRLMNIVIVLISLTVFVFVWWGLSIFFDLNFFPPSD